MSDTAETIASTEATEAKVKFVPSNKTVTVSLPSMPNSRVTLRTDMTADEAEKISLSMPDQIDGRSVNIIMMRLTVAAMFVSWNLVDDNDKDLQCTEDILRKFNFMDIATMMQAISGRKIIGDDGEFLNPDESKKKTLNV